MANTWAMPEQPKIAEAGIIMDTDGRYWVLEPNQSWWELATPERARQIANTLSPFPLEEPKK